MSTSDQQGNQPLTRKQLREIRLTGATPVITEDEAAAAAAAAIPPVPAAPQSTDTVPAEPVPAPRADADVDLDEPPLTRRQVREQERIRTASVPVITRDDAPAEEEAPGDAISKDESDADGAPEAEILAEETDRDEIFEDENEAPESDTREDEIVSRLPEFTTVALTDDFADTADEDVDDAAVDIAPVSAAAAAEPAGEVLIDVDETADSVDADGTDDSGDEIDALGIAADDGDDDSDAAEDPIATGERPVVNSMFGKGLLAERADVPAFAPSFDDLITSDSTGSQHLAPNTLIFTPSSREGSLSGPVASTGELLITGSYDLPRGIGSQGHAHGTTDGKEADAVLIDGELPPSSSPTPIAASSAISTTKPAGEVIRPPVPEKGNKLMLTLAIMAGGLALALAVVLIVAFTTGLF